MKTLALVALFVVLAAAGYLVYKQRNCGCDEETFEPKRNGSRIADEAVAKLGGEA